jgi:hypothetical protein
MESECSLLFSREPTSPRSSVTFHNNLAVYGEGLLASRPILQLKDYLLWVVRDYLFNIFIPTLHIL